MLDVKMPPQCKKCARGIVYVFHERTGKKAPIDAAPTPGGSILIDAGANTYKIIPKDKRADYPGQLHKPHWETCPNAGEFRSQR